MDRNKITAIAAVLAVAVLLGGMFVYIGLTASPSPGDLEEANSQVETAAEPVVEPPSLSALALSLGLGVVMTYVAGIYGQGTEPADGGKTE